MIRTTWLFMAVFLLSLILSESNKSRAQVTLNESSNVNIKNNVITSADSSGNSGSVQTGDASASTSVKNNISTGESGQTNIQTDASAEANGQKVQISTQGDQPVSIQKKTADGQSQASVEVQTKINNENSTDKSNKRSQNASQTIVAKVINTFEGALSWISNGVKSLFS